MSEKEIDEEEEKEKENEEEEELYDLFDYTRTLNADYSTSSELKNEDEDQHEPAVEQEQESGPVLNEEEEEHDPEIEEVEEQTKAPIEEDLIQATTLGLTTRSKKRKVSGSKGKSSKRVQEREENE